MELPRAVNGWEEQGRRLARGLDDVAAALVVADDPEAAAHVALGIARVQGLYRRVAVGDLVGDVTPLRIEGDEDPHGLTDCFQYGVSLNRIARPLRGSRNVFVLPCGCEGAMPEDVMRHERWQRLVAGFREMDALLLLVARPQAAGLESLARATEGAVAVGAPELGAIPTLARVRAPRTASRVVPEDRTASEAVVTATAAAAGATPASRHGREPSSIPSASARRRWPLAAAAAAVLVVAGGLGGSALLRARSNGSPDTDPRTMTAIPDSSRGAVAADAEPPAVVVANPQDSASAAAFAVEVVKANTEVAALAHLRGDSTHLPALTVAPVVLSDGSRWYRVLSGAYPNSIAAESLLIALRGTPLLVSDPGSIVHAPFALLALADADSAAARAEIERLRERGVSAYGLVQPTGRVHVYVGAFATAEDAASAETPVREAGVTPAVVYRIGRAF